MPIEPPIILVGDGQVEMFQNADSVARNVEAIDAQLYKAYDVKGRPIRISGKFKTSGGWFGIRLVTEDGPVTVELISDEPSHAEELRAALVDWWIRTRYVTPASPPPSEERWALAELVAAIVERDGIR